MILSNLALRHEYLRHCDLKHYFILRFSLRHYFAMLSCLSARYQKVQKQEAAWHRLKIDHLPRIRFVHQLLGADQACTR